VKNKIEEEVKRTLNEITNKEQEIKQVVNEFKNGGLILFFLDSRKSLRKPTEADRRET
jgi:hypothetical protein